MRNRQQRASIMRRSISSATSLTRQRSLKSKEVSETRIEGCSEGNLVTFV